MMISNKKIVGSKILIIGAGSGRDISASAFFIDHFRKNNAQQIDIAGFLTPWAIHFFNNKIEKTINKIPANSYAKFSFFTKKQTNVFFEATLPALNKQLNLGIDNIFLFSLQYGTEQLKKDLNQLIKAMGYDVIIAVDVGGDILADRVDFKTILTPMVDLACLDILAGLNIPVTKYLAVVMPGVCGEIPPARLKAIINETRNNNSLIATWKFDKLSPEFQNYKILNEKIHEKTTSYSHTAKIICEITEKEPISDLQLEYKKTYQINGKKWDIFFPVILPKQFFSRIYFFDLQLFKSYRNKIAMRYNSIIEGFMKSKMLGTCGTEVDLSFIPIFLDKKHFMENTTMILNPCCYTNKIQKIDIVNHVLMNFESDNVENILLSQQDIEIVKNQKNINFYPVGNHFLFITRKPNNILFIRNIYESII